jgi:hypothetical protein
MSEYDDTTTAGTERNRRGNMIGISHEATHLHEMIRKA